MEEVPRPVPSPSLGGRAREWVEWFGLARLVTSAIAVVIVVVGGWLLVRPPVPPSEASLPRASIAAIGSAPSSVVPTSVSPSDAAVEPTGRFVVHVAGAVERPGVYEVDAGERVQRAIDLAGGPTPAADDDALNLAAVVVDGSRVYVPEVGEDVGPAVLEPVGGASATTAGGPAGPVDVNRASTGELETLPGVGPATATAIVTERDRNGPFVSVDDLERVPGIGPAKLAALRDLVIA